MRSAGHIFDVVLDKNYNAQVQYCSHAEVLM